MFNYEATYCAVQYGLLSIRIVNLTVETTLASVNALSLPGRQP